MLDYLLSLRQVKGYFEKFRRGRVTRPSWRVPVGRIAIPGLFSDEYMSLEPFSGLCLAPDLDLDDLSQEFQVFEVNLAPRYCLADPSLPPFPLH